jgi:hypothetical protein
MKKLIVLFLALFAFASCQIPPPKQVTPNWKEEIIGLQNIPEENMPGFKHEEPRLECIAPCLFGLDYNPCCKVKKPKTYGHTHQKFEWATNPQHALDHTGGEKLLLVLFRRSENDSKQIMELLDEQCSKEELNKNYSGFLIEGDQALLNMVKDHTEKPLKWLSRDFAMSPTLLFVKVSVENDELHGHALPIMFQGRINTDMCNLLKGFYQSSR